MRIGASLFLIAVGAILTFAVTANVSGVSLSTIGIILMIVGGIGLLAELMYQSTRRHEATTVVTQQPGVVYTDPVERRY
jgi:membrane-bound ClpP family serine protease